jgi:cysteine desulfurase
METIYLDYNATTPVDPEVCDAILSALRESWGNPSSGHAIGRKAREAVERARAEVAGLIGAHPEEVVFTSGGTEATQLALIGAAAALRERSSGKAISLVSFTLEHPATLVCLDELRQRGDRVELIPPDSLGVIRMSSLVDAMRSIEPPAIVSLMHAHNETGALQPVEETGRLIRERGFLFHVDAAQTLGKVPVLVDAIGCDLLSIAGHKLYGPKGIGALYVRQGTPVRSLLRGAGQERGLRGGTPNVPGIVGLGTACRIARRHLETGGSGRLAGLRERLWSGLRAEIPGIRRTSEGTPTLPNTLHVRFPGVTGNALLAATPEVAASTGSACHAGSDRPPEALLAMGVPEQEALGSVRLSLGRSSDEEKVDRAVRHLAMGWRSIAGGNPDGIRR